MQIWRRRPSDAAAEQHRIDIAALEEVELLGLRGAAIRHFEKAVTELSGAKSRSRGVAAVAAVVGLIALFVGSGLGYWSTARGAAAIDQAKNPAELLVFELVRTTATAALIGAFIWGMLNLARAALDQGTRYEKRFVAGHFLVYILETFDDEIRRGDVSIADAVAVFKSWNDSVESAYTHVRFGSRGNQAFAFSGSKDGISLAAGGAEQLNLPKGEEKGTQK